MRITVFISGLLMAFNTNAFCFQEAGARFDVNPDLLKAIAFSESSMSQDAVSHNRIPETGEILTSDYGLMQINSSWFPRFESMGIEKLEIIEDACTNVLAGTWILAMNFETSGETWLSVGAYNAGYKKSKSKEAARQKYISTVKTNLERISDA